MDAALSMLRFLERLHTVIGPAALAPSYFTCAIPQDSYNRLLAAWDLSLRRVLQ